MSGSQLVQLLVLGSIIAALTGKTTASRHTRQAGRCSTGQQCILLTACPELLALLNPPTQAGIQRLQGLTCAFDRRNPKVCCDVSSNVTPPVTNKPPVTPTRTPVPVTPPTIGVAPGNDCSGTGSSPLLPQQCGSIGERVIGGTELPVRSYMWMALLGYGRSSRPDWSCGGSLISQRYVVTAAHCIDRSFAGILVRVRLGEHDIRNSPDCQRGNIGREVCAPPVQDFTPEQTIMHPDWNKRTNFSDDIALIRLDRPAQFHGYVQPICLPPPCMDISNFLRSDRILREAEVAGWGRTESGRHSDVKLMVKLPFVPLDKCKPLNKLPLVEKGQVCFGGEVGKDSCGGDSGGPLVSTDLKADSTNLYVLLGVVSYGPIRCGREPIPAVYTDVAQYRNWIVRNLRP